jgi:hypothetical protein
MLLGILVSHAALVWVLERSLFVHAPQTSGQAAALTVTLVEEPRPAPEPDSAWPGWRPAAVERVRPILPVPVMPSREEGSGAITDWGSEAEAAAADVVRQERERAAVHPFTHVTPAPAARESPGIFGSQSENQRSGRVDGGASFWVSDNCYYEFPRMKPESHPAGEFHLLTPVCKPAPTGGGGELFRSLTPDYLKRPPGERTPPAPQSQHDASDPK